MALALLACVADGARAFIGLTGNGKAGILENLVDDDGGRMSKAAMPPRTVRRGDGERVPAGQFICGDGVETSFTGPLKKNPPRRPILYKETMRMKLKKYVVIIGESMSRKKIFASTWNM